MTSHNEPGDHRTTVAAEDARREEREREQRENPQEFTGRDHSTEPRDADAVREDDRLTASENEDQSEG